MRNITEQSTKCIFISVTCILDNQVSKYAKQAHSALEDASHRETILENVVQLGSILRGMVYEHDYLYSWEVIFLYMEFWE